MTVPVTERGCLESGNTQDVSRRAIRTGGRLERWFKETQVKMSRQHKKSPIVYGLFTLKMVGGVGNVKGVGGWELGVGAGGRMGVELKLWGRSWWGCGGGGGEELGDKRGGFKKIE